MNEFLCSLILGSLASEKKKAIALILKSISSMAGETRWWWYSLGFKLRPESPTAGAR
ncbi:MAG: hypothetical protein ICV78_06020 [Tolypothrix sp. Co-bin9]|nr:hypothetical protein [Tolypothrix sp. Co-bin9]